VIAEECETSALKQVIAHASITVDMRNEDVYFGTCGSQKFRLEFSKVIHRRSMKTRASDFEAAGRS